MAWPVKAADVGVAGDIDTIEGDAGRVGVDLDVLDDQVVRRVVGNRDPGIARRLELAGTGQGIGGDADAAELRLDVGNGDEISRRAGGRHVRQRQIDHIGIGNGVGIAGNLAVEDEEVVDQVVALGHQHVLLASQRGHLGLQRGHGVRVVVAAFGVGQRHVG